MGRKKFTARKVRTPGSQAISKHKAPKKKGRPKSVTPKSLHRGRYKANYTDNMLLDALDSIESGQMSERAAAQAYGIPRSTLKDRRAERVTRETAGRPTVLSKDEELLIVERLQIQASWGFPLTSKELCIVIKGYLDSLGKTTRFVDNTPGRDFVAGFLRRHPDLTVRKANMIKRTRAAVSHKVVKDFFARFAKTVKDIPPSNVFNYDETNLQDNPGCSKAIFRKGTKYAEQVRNHSKSAVSVMFCGSATGQLLPPYVVYKGQNVWEDWCVGGVKGSVYSSTPSGWFDGFTFKDWFVKVFLPASRRLEGRKLLLGDNLSSHLSVEVINLCSKNDIEFVCLPPNSTHVLQPLDVGLFGPMKACWRRQLREYAAQDASASLLRKTVFPKMLKELVETLNFEQHLPKESVRSISKIFVQKNCLIFEKVSLL
jgi:hypothetical protein